MINFLWYCLGNWQRNSHVMSESPCRRYFSGLWFVDQRLEYSLSQRFIIQVEVDIDWDFFLLALYCETWVFISDSVCDFPALVRIKQYSEWVLWSIMLCINNVVEAVATWYYFASMRLVGILNIVIVVIKSIGSAIFKEEGALSLTESGDILLLGVWKIEVEDPHVLVMKLEMTNVLVLGVTSREVVLLKAYVMRELQCEAILPFNILIKYLINSDIKILCYYSLIWLFSCCRRKNSVSDLHCYWIVWSNLDIKPLILDIVWHHIHYVWLQICCV